jgi:prolyl-tRNA editing enzyme YbaK/EbsC (Cys-tRNA(Pro) deacylase)
MMTMQSPVIDLLNAEQMAFELIEIPLSDDKKPIRSLEALLLAKGLKPDSVVRSVVFKDDSGAYCLLAVAGSGRADWGVLRKHLNVRKCRMAEYAEVSEATGYVVGAVPPVALPDGLRVLLDNSVLDYETVVIGSGVLGFALAIKQPDLLRLMQQAEKGQFVKTGE